MISFDCGHCDQYNLGSLPIDICAAYCRSVFSLCSDPMSVDSCPHYPSMVPNSYTCSCPGSVIANSMLIVTLELCHGAWAVQRRWHARAIYRILVLYDVMALRPAALEP